ncbi:methionine ABC transporter ATP-binding protein [Calorimonas adulescens]|uniref:Methionine ABC transporter ATP-binding protein n=1 Tax=Calorimonas adulescens TaxID=2606906 RepID=A0A5D8QAB1_9THEO|nr:methionine ABC transporter ATP-binding protein [Calorimonas adulescens]TZE81695.1 methionine ABC transporter ATP-binding protein [Calorimonas adulescens]
MILIKNLTKVYRTENESITALKNINLEINDGEIFGIMGLSGAGKSSLIRCINRLEEPTEGTIEINGQDIMSLNNKELREMRKKIGMIFQHFNLLSNKTVYENIAFPMEISGVSKDVIDKRIKELLDMVGLADKKDSYPSQLSGGQKQRVGIARALANGPTLLLSDEATSALDPQTTSQILSLLKEINKRLNLTIIVITHQMDVIKEICDRVAVLNAGELVEVGNVVDIFSQPSSQITKKFVGIEEGMPDSIIDYDRGMVVKVLFIGKSAREPVISHLIKTFDVDVNILSGNIQHIHGETIGNLVIGLEGQADKINNAVEWLKNQGLKIEVLK